MADRTPKETAWAVTRMLIGIGLVLASVLIFQRTLAGNDAALRSACQPGVIVLEAQDYSRDNRGVFPPLSPEAGRLTYDVKLMEPYMALAGKHVCASDPDAPGQPALEAMPRQDAVNDWSYVYLGFCIEDEAQGLAFVEAYRARVAQGAAFGTDLQVPPGTGNCGGNVLHRLMEPGLMADLAPCVAAHPERIPVVVEWPGHHEKPGGRVVYLDGHSEFVAYPGPFPMTERFIGALRELDRMSE